MRDTFDDARDAGQKRGDPGLDDEDDKKERPMMENAGYVGFILKCG